MNAEKVSLRQLIIQLFIQKRTYVYYALIIQLFAIIFFLIVGQFDNFSFMIDNHLIVTDKGPFSNIIFQLFFMTSAIIDMFFCGVLCWQNQRINLSQTWHLVPVSSSKLYLGNLISSLLECAYIFIVQIASIFLIGWIAVKTMTDTNEISIVKGYFSFNFSTIIQSLLMLVLLVLGIFLFVDFCNFFGSVIAETLPVKNTKILRWIIMLVLAIIGIYLVYQANINFEKYYYKLVIAKPNIGPNFITYTIGESNLEMFIEDIILAIFDWIMINKYFEPKN